MNVHVTHPVMPATLGAEGLPRRRWSVAEIFRLIEAGIIAEHERFELIGGEIVPMSAKSVPHETVKMELSRFWTKSLPDDLNLLTETTLYINDHEFLEPDFIFWPRSIALAGLKPKDILLLVEVADSSLSYDLGRKAQIYASLGIRDYWTIDAPRLITRIHRSPGDAGFATAPDVPHKDMLTPLLLPALAVRLADLGLRPLAGSAVD
jgi:Uma2 family endonuclease